MQERKVTGTLHPGTLPLGTALDQSQPLVRLLRRLQESRARFDTIGAQLPDTLRDQVRPGPLDDDGWSLLVANGAAASKLRQLVPLLDATLLAQGWPVASIRIRVQAV